MAKDNIVDLLHYTTNERLQIKSHFDKLQNEDIQHENYIEEKSNIQRTTTTTTHN